MSQIYNIISILTCYENSLKYFVNINLKRVSLLLSMEIKFDSSSFIAKKILRYAIILSLLRQTQNQALH